MSLAEAGKLEEADRGLRQDRADGTSGYRVLARLRAASVTAARDKAAAVKGFDAVAADSSIDSKLRDLAAIRAGFLLVDSAPLTEMQQRLEPLTARRAPFVTPHANCSRSRPSARRTPPRSSAGAT